jgi:hypothetical protein
MIPECYIPDEKIRNLRDLARRRHYFVNTRTMFKNKVHVELSKRWIDYSTDNSSSKSDLFTQNGLEQNNSLPTLIPCFITENTVRVSKMQNAKVRKVFQNSIRCFIFRADR